MLKSHRYLILLLILFIIITFFLIKKFSEKNDYVQNVIAEEIDINQNKIEDKQELSVDFIYEDFFIIKDGQTFGNLIKGYNISDTEQYKISQLLNSKIDLTRINIGTEIRITYIRKDDLINIQKISIIDKKNNEIQLVKKNGTYEIKSSSLLSFTKNILKEVTINNSLYTSAINAGIPPNIIMQFVNLYGFDVDFQREIRNGNKIKVYYEVFLDSKHNIKKAGNIKFASLSLSNNTYELYKFTTTDDNKTEYFDAEGKSAVKALMKTPINGASLSSGYGMRKHPIQIGRASCRERV